MGTAALVTNFAPRWPAWELRSTTGGVGPVTFPASKLRILVELYLGGQWVDVSAYVLTERQCIITRGRRNNQRKTQTATCALTFRNDDGRFSPRNVNGAYAGLLGRNTPIRVSIDPGSGMVRRFTGKVPSWVPEAKGHPNDRQVSIVAVGVRGRLERGKSVVKSPPRRFMPTTSFLWAYWSLESGAYADDPGRADVGVHSMRPFAGLHSSGALIGYPQWGSGQLAPWLPPVLSRSATAGLTVIWAPVEMDFNTSWSVHFAYNSGTGAGISTVDVNPTYLGSTLGWQQLTLDPANRLILSGLNGEPEDSAVVDNLYDGLPHVVSWTVSQSGGNGLSEVYVDGVQVISATTAGAMTVQPIRLLGLSAEAQSGSGIAQGHVGVWSPGFASAQVLESVLGYRGESPTDRFARLCTEEGLSYSVPELITDNQAMGPQRAASIIDLLDECADANEGILDEDLNNRLRLISRTYRYNREVALTLDFAAGQIQPPFKSADDDVFARNDWTLTRTGGEPQQYEKTSGSLNINAPESDPKGIGRYDEVGSIVVDTDARALLHAGYRVFRDTIDEPRFPGLSINLTKAPGLISGWLACDIGSRVLAVNPLDELGPDDVDATIEGYTESFDQTAWDIDLYLEPDTISKVARYNFDRYDCAGSTLAEDLDTTETGVDLTISDQCVWAHDTGDFVISVGLEDMLVTAVAAAGGSLGAYTQTLTVTRSYNGVVATHSTGAEVHLKTPARYAL